MSATIRSADAELERRRRRHRSTSAHAHTALLESTPAAFRALPRHEVATHQGEVVLHGVVHAQRVAHPEVQRAVAELVQEHEDRVFFEYRLARLLGQDKERELMTARDVRDAVGARGTRMLLAGLAIGPIRGLVARRAQHDGDPLLTIFGRARRDPRWLPVAAEAATLCLPPLHEGDLELLAASSAAPTLALSLALAERASALRDPASPLHLVVGVLHVDQLAVLLQNPDLAAAATAALAASARSRCDGRSPRPSPI